MASFIAKFVSPIATLLAFSIPLDSRAVTYLGPLSVEGQLKEAELIVQGTVTSIAKREIEFQELRTSGLKESTLQSRKLVVEFVFDVDRVLSGEYANRQITFVSWGSPDSELLLGHEYMLEQGDNLIVLLRYWNPAAVWLAVNQINGIYRIVESPSGDNLRPYAPRHRLYITDPRTVSVPFKQEQELEEISVLELEQLIDRYSAGSKYGRMEVQR